MISVDTGKPINSKGRMNSMANMVPADQDPNDPQVKKELFLKLMAKSPAFLLGEINARLGTDDESLAASDRLSSIMKRVEGGSIMDLPEDDRQWTLKLVKNALLNMELHRASTGDQEEFGKTEPESEFPEPDPDPEENMPEESVDFGDIRSEYGIEEAACDCCGNDPCDCPPDCEGCGSMDESEEAVEDAVEETATNALDAALAELKSLAGL